jgi:Na+/proline symporter
VIEILGFFAAWITMMLGSIPQQDVFQRVMSSKTARIAGAASVLGGVLYFIFAFVPIFLAYSATLVDPALVQRLLGTDPQLILPSFIIAHAPIAAQILFFGALLSAIKSCASATLLAPSVTFAENILKPLFPGISDRRFLRLMQAVVLGFTVIVLIYAMNTSQHLQDGRERLQGDAGVRLRAAHGGALLEAPVRPAAWPRCSAGCSPGSGWKPSPPAVRYRRNSRACWPASPAW